VHSREPLPKSSRFVWPRCYRRVTGEAKARKSWLPAEELLQGAHAGGVAETQASDQRDSGCRATSESSSVAATSSPTREAIAASVA
jgi:hypothetical protein